MTELPLQPSHSNARPNSAETDRLHAQNVRRVLEHPVFVEMPEYVRKIRNTLMLVSVIALAFEPGGLGLISKADGSATFAGVALTGLTDYKVAGALLALILYKLVYFLWCSRDGWAEWKIRCSGVALAFVHSKRHPSGMFPDPAHSSLMSWWVHEVTNVQGMKAETKELQGKVDALLTQYPSATLPPGSTYPKDLMEAFFQVTDKKTQLYKMGVSANSEPLLRDALNCYEQFYKGFLNSQNRRWLIFEFLFPVVLALVAVAFLVKSLLHFWLSVV